MELTETGDEDFPPDHAVAYCGECDAMVAFRSLNPLSDWLCDLGDRTDLDGVDRDRRRGLSAGPRRRVLRRVRRDGRVSLAQPFVRLALRFGRPDRTGDHAARRAVSKLRGATRAADARADVG